MRDRYNRDQIAKKIIQRGKSVEEGTFLENAVVSGYLGSIGGWMF
jgi:hypothetical protein